MSPEKQIVAIATACGWKSIRPCVDSICGFVGFAPSNPFPHDNGEDNIPDFTEDLNAMAEAEKALSDNWSIYLGWLWKITNPPVDWKSNRVVHIQNHLTWNFHRATSEQRCEAFLKTIGKWES